MWETASTRRAPCSHVGSPRLTSGGVLDARYLHQLLEEEPLARSGPCRCPVDSRLVGVVGWRTPAGRTFDEVIGEALASARCVVVVWSKESIASSWVREEADEGRRRGILIPVLIDEGRPPFGFGRIQAVDLADWNGLDTAATFKKLVMDIASILGPPQAPGVQTATVVSPATERQGAAPALATRDSVDGSREASRSTVREPDVDVQARAVSRQQRHAQTAPVHAHESASEHSPSGRPGKALRWSLATVLLLVFLALGLYGLKTGSHRFLATAPNNRALIRFGAPIERSPERRWRTAHDRRELRGLRDGYGCRGQSKARRWQCGVPMDLRASRCRRVATTSPPLTGAPRPALKWR